VDDRLGAAERARQVRDAAYVAADHLEALLVREVPEAAAEELRVQDADAVAAIEEKPGECRAEVARAAGDDDPRLQWIPPRPIWRESRRALVRKCYQMRCERDVPQDGAA